MRQGSTRLYAAVIALGLVLAGTAVAQQTYQLGSKGQWKKESKLDPKTPAGQLQIIRTTLAKGDADKAWDLADKWIKEYPNQPMLPEAYLLRGDAKVADYDYYKALYDYETIARLYPAAEQFQTALEREFMIAKLFLSGVKRKLWGMRIIPAEDDAEELLIRIQERAPGSDLGQRASLALADYYFKSAQMTSAVTAYEMFLVNYPDSPYRQQAGLRLIQANLATFHGPTFDSTGLLEAAQRLKAYQKEYPASAERLGARALLVRINESEALKELRTAQWYDGQHMRVSAVYMYQRVVHDYPASAAAQQAVARLTAWHAPVAAAAAKTPTTGSAITKPSDEDHGATPDEPQEPGP